MADSEDLGTSEKIQRILAIQSRFGKLGAAEQIQSNQGLQDWFKEPEGFRLEASKQTWCTKGY